MLRCLIGPVAPGFPAALLPGSPDRLLFDTAGKLEHTLPAGGTWDDLLTRLPDGWRPDAVVLWLSYSSVPTGLWNSPVPIIGLAPEWNLLWHGYRRALRRCDRVISDSPGVAVMHREGIEQARFGQLAGLEVSVANEPAPERERDIDVLFVGNVHSAVCRERNPWLGRLAQLAARWKVVIRADMARPQRRELLSRAKLVFNRSNHGECDKLVFEAVAAGAIVLQERKDDDIAVHLRRGSEYVPYDANDLEDIVEHYLTHDSERAAIAAAARQRSGEFTFDAFFAKIIADVGRDLPGLQERARQRGANPLRGDLTAAVWAVLSGGDARELDRLLKEGPESVEHLLAAGMFAPNPAEAAARFSKVLEVEPAHPLAGLNRAEALALAGRKEDAITQARKTLSDLESVDGLQSVHRECAHYPAGFDVFRVEWERIAWQNAGDPLAELTHKRALVRWRLHGLLGDLTGDLAHYESHAAARRDLPTGRAALGCGLARAKYLEMALPHLRAAVDGNPFDTQAARAFYQCLRDAGQLDRASRFAEARRRLASAAPNLVPVEAWFSEAGLAIAQATAESLAVVIEGDVDAVHSLAAVNRSLAECLTQRGHLVTVRPTAMVPAGRLPGQHPANRMVGRTLPRPADICIRHRWPPDFSPLAEGRLVIMQPWEFGSAPRSWVEAVAADYVAEVWAPSHSVRDGFIRSGMPASKVHVVPYGVDVSVFKPGLNPYSLATAKRFKFLYMGGTIWRKGFDILLAAYGQAFTAENDVCLVVKDMGVGQFYRNQTAEKEIAAFQARPGAPAIEYLTTDLPESDLAGLYAACNCLAMPFRGEGFGLPIAEAMACDLPVIVTDAGPIKDWCDASNAYLLPAREVRFKDKRVGDLETTDYPCLAEADPVALAALLRHVHANPAEAAAIARAGSATIHNRLTWDHAIAIAEGRLRKLRQSQPADSVQRAADPPIVVETTARPKVSLCLIVKNEEKNLAACLTPLRGIVGEIIVVDTGSTDNTKQIAASLGARVFETPWPDSFAAARNVSLDHARGEWIFWMDADDRIDPENLDKLQKLFASLDGSNRAYSMKCVCVASVPGDTATVVDHVRLFRNDPRHRWKYRVHEQILHAVRATLGAVRWVDIIIHHTGYTDTALRNRKLERDLRLIQLDYQDNPNDAFTLFNLGSAYGSLNRSRDALQVFRRSLELSNVTDSIVRKLYALIVKCHRELKETTEALTACAEGRKHYPNDAELLFLESNVFRDHGDDRSAEERLHRLINGMEDNHFASVATGLRGYLARHNLAVICSEQKRYAEAETHWLTAIHEEPAFFQAHVGLGETYAKTKKWEKLEAVSAAIAKLGPHGEQESQYLLGLGKFHLGDLSTARFWLTAANDRFPGSLRIKRLLAEVTLKEGVDLAGAERFLREIVALDPNDERAKKAIADLGQRRR